MSEILDRYAPSELDDEVDVCLSIDVDALEAKLEAMGRVVEVAEEAERIANEAHLAADHYAYDLMRTVLRPLVGEMERSVEQALEEEQE